MRKNFHQVRHPLATHKLSHMRKRPKDCPSRDFTHLMREMGMLMAYAVTQHLPLGNAKTIVTERSGSIEVRMLSQNKPVIVPILRTGLVMADGMNDVIQTTYTGHIGLHHEGGEPEMLYLVTLPDQIEMASRHFIVVDPVVARGVTACRAISVLREFGAQLGNIYFATILTSEEGMALVAEGNSDVQFFYVECDDLVEHELRPGLGSVSSRLFRTA